MPKPNVVINSFMQDLEQMDASSMVARFERLKPSEQRAAVARASDELMHNLASNSIYSELLNHAADVRLQKDEDKRLLAWSLIRDCTKAQFDCKSDTQAFAPYIENITAAARDENDPNCLLEIMMLIESALERTRDYPSFQSAVEDILNKHEYRARHYLETAREKYEGAKPLYPQAPVKAQRPMTALPHYEIKKAALKPLANQSFKDWKKGDALEFKAQAIYITPFLNPQTLREKFEGEVLKVSTKRFTPAEIAFASEGAEDPLWIEKLDMDGRCAFDTSKTPRFLMV